MLTSIPYRLSLAASDTLETVAQEVSDADSLTELLKNLQPYALSIGLKLLELAVIYFIGSRLIRLFITLLDHTFNRIGSNETLRRFMRSFVHIGLYAILVFIMAGEIGINMGTLAALLGSGAVAIGLALQDDLSHFAGGVFILLMHPFQVGNYITTSEGDCTVLEIGLVYTKLKTPDNRIIIIPNGKLASITVTNNSLMPIRRMDISCGISYGADIQKAKTIMEQVIRSCETVLQEEPVTVFVDSLGDSSVTIASWCWCKGSDYLATKHWLLENVKLAFDANGVEIPFPQVDVHIRDQA